MVSSRSATSVALNPLHGKPGRAAQPAFMLMPSLLSAPFERLGPAIEELQKAGAHVFHYDVMDGHFVPNLTIGPVLIESLQKSGVTCEFDVHLMVTNPEIQMKWFNVDLVRSVTIHHEVSRNIKRDMGWIREHGKKAGLALNPPTEIREVEANLEHVDQVLVMSVYPGFAGQPFLHESLAKIEALVALRAKYDYHYTIQVDGGINPDTIQAVIDAGVDEVVSGSAIFSQSDPQKAYHDLCNRTPNSPAKD